MKQNVLVARVGVEVDWKMKVTLKTKLDPWESVRARGWEGGGGVARLGCVFLRRASPRVECRRGVHTK